jgi:hypothetical protein
MNPAGNVLAKGLNQGEHDKLEGTASKSETSFDYKRRFLEVKAATLLSYALHADTPLGAALVSGSQLIFTLRENGIRSAKLTLSKESRL